MKFNELVTEFCRANEEGRAVEGYIVFAPQSFELPYRCSPAPIWFLPTTRDSRRECPATLSSVRPWMGLTMVFAWTCIWRMPALKMAGS